MKIETRMNRIEKKISELEVQRSELRKECHELGHEGKLTGRYGANTGNWSSTDDHYWVDFYCPQCGKRWTEDQDDVWFDRKDKVRRTKDGILYAKVES